MTHKETLKAIKHQVTKIVEKNTSQQKLIAAFDADGTLWPADVGRSFFAYQVKEKLLEKKVSDPSFVFNQIRSQKGEKEAFLWLAKVQAGVLLDQFNDWVGDFLKKNSFQMFSFQEDILNFLRKKKVHIFVVSSSLKWTLVKVLKNYDIPPENIIGVETQVLNGKITDKAILPTSVEEGKVFALQKKTNGKLPFFVSGNTLADKALLESSTHIRWVVSKASPKEKNYGSEKKLLKIAKEKNWFYID